MQYLNSLKQIPQLFCLMMLFLLGIGPANAQLIPLNGAATAPINISDQVSTYEDSSGNHTLEEVIKNGKFVPNHHKIANFGLTKSTIWIRFNVADAQKSTDFSFN